MIAVTVYHIFASGVKGKSCDCVIRIYAFRKLKNSSMCDDSRQTALLQY